MSESVFSPYWHRVAGSHPQLNTHVVVVRQMYRGALWFVLQDRSSGKHYRLDESSYRFVGRLDGRNSVQQIWDTLCEDSRGPAPTQNEVVHLLSELSEANLLHSEHSPEFSELFRRRDERAAKRQRAFVNPLAFQVPLFNPVRLLDRLLPLARFLFTPAMLSIWAFAVLVGLALATSSAAEIRTYASEHILTPRFLLLLWLSYPLIKVLHELGHALATRVWGGQVNEMGITLLLLVPVPYVDASSASAFPSKWRRAVVGAIGVMTELALAVLATLLWSCVEDGLVREIAFAIMFVGTISTLLFNGNPLLRFDAYYALTDVLELPNLAARSRAYWSYLAERYVLGISSLRSLGATRGERAWLLAYGAAATIYRVVLSFAIAVWLSAKSALLGYALLAWFAWSLFLLPAWRAAMFLATSSQLTRRRAKALVVVAALVFGISAFVFFVPIPLYHQVEGVVWLPEQARVRASTDGFIDQVVALDGQQVVPGDVLLVMSNPKLSARRDELQAQHRRLVAMHSSAVGFDLPRAQTLADELAKIENELQQVDGHIQGLVVRSVVAGTVVLPHAQDVVGSYVGKGVLLAHVLNAKGMMVRTLLPEDAIPLVRTRGRGVQVRLAETFAAVLPARIVEETPQASNDLPSPALGDKGGGTWTTDPADHKGMRSLDPFFVVDVQVEKKTEIDLGTREAGRVGGRAYARFDLGSEPLAERFYRAGRRLFLRHFANGVG